MVLLLSIGKTDSYGPRENTRTVKKKVHGLVTNETERYGKKEPTRTV